jgi:hypothetical protein
MSPKRIVASLPRLNPARLPLPLRAWSLSWPDHKALSTPLSSLKFIFSNWQGWAQELLHITSRAPQNLQLSASREFRCTKLSGWWQSPRVTRKSIVNGSLVPLNVISQRKYTCWITPVSPRMQSLASICEWRLNLSSSVCEYQQASPKEVPSPGTSSI